MYAICHTNNDDVLACIREQVKRGYKYPIFQVGQKLYRTLGKNRGMVPETIRRKVKKYVVNLTTETYHVDGCGVLKRTKDKCKLGAYMVRPKRSGLKACRVCCS